jgi:hypothetical protein
VGRAKVVQDVFCESGDTVDTGELRINKIPSGVVKVVVGHLGALTRKLGNRDGGVKDLLPLSLGKSSRMSCPWLGSFQPL